jgi:hypothetical protein
VTWLEAGTSRGLLGCDAIKYQRFEGPCCLHLQDEVKKVVHIDVQKLFYTESKELEEPHIWRKLLRKILFSSKKIKLTLSNRSDAAFCLWSTD